MDTKRKPGFGRKTKQFPDSKLPPRIIFVLKVLLLYMFVVYYSLLLNPTGRFPFLPFLTILDLVPSYFFSFAIIILSLSILSVLLKKGNYRIVSLGSGSIILLLILSSKPFYSNSLLFVGCLLILIGFYKDNDYLFRIQISLLYVGASANKMFDPDWWNGHYFDFFFRDVYDVSLYKSLVPNGSLTLAKSMGMATMLTELMLGIFVLIPQLTRFMILLGLIFHAAMLIITSGQLSILFLYIMSAAFLLISGLKIHPIHISHRTEVIPTLLSWLDLSESLIPENHKEKRFTVRIQDKVYTGKRACLKLLLSKQSLITIYFISIILYMRISLIINKLVIPML